MSAFATTLDQARTQVVPESLSGFSETLFGYGTPVERATHHDDVVKNVYIRINTKQWQTDGSPFIKREYYSATLIGGILWRYHTLAVDQQVDYYNPNNVNGDLLDLIRTNCCSVMPSREVTKIVLDSMYYAAYGTDSNIDPFYVDPEVGSQVSERARSQASSNHALDESREETSQAQKDADENGIIDRVLDGVTTPFKMVSNLGTAMSIIIPTMVVGIAGTVIYLVVTKGKQLDVNEAFRQQQETVRVVGPDAVAAIVRKGR